MTRHHAHIAAVVTLHAVAVMSANLLTSRLGMVPVGFGLIVTAGTFAAGFALLARDVVHRVAGVRWVFAGIGLGAALSWLTASPQLAVASAVAFGTAELVDILVFVPLRERRGFAAGAVGSNVVSAPVDTVVFLAIAGFPITFGAVAGQFVGKVFWATITPLVIWAVSREVLRHYQQRRDAGRYA